MKKINITTPENIEVEYTLAGLVSRTAAALIDTMIQGVILILFAVAALLIFLNAREFWDDYFGWIIGIALLVYALISYGYFIAMELTMNGMTIGKRVFGLRAIRNNGQSITLKHSVLRNLFRVFIDTLGVGIVMMFFSKENKRLGDYVASTIVVIEEKKNQPITLEGLMKGVQEYSYYISKEEHELLRDYFERKSTMEDPFEVQMELKKYFMRKFDEMGILENQRSFIDSL